MNSTPADALSPQARLGATLRRPIFWLVVQSLALVVFVGTTGGLDPKFERDTRTYIAASKATSVREALSHIRTVGYPLLLRALKQVDFGRSGPYARVPAVQLLIYLGAVWLFWVGLSCFLEAPWLALAASSPLLWGQPLALMRSLLPDFLAMAFAIAAMGALFLLAVRPNRWLWIALATALFASYQLRPAGVFLIAFVPVLAVLLWRLRNRASWVKALRFGAIAAVVAVGPYLGFATLRWVAVGHFGLVSFGGFNAAGMAMLFLDDDLIRELPAEERLLAEQIQRRRARRGWGVVSAADDLDEVIRQQYSKNIFKIGMAKARILIREELEATGGALNTRRLDRPDFLVVEGNRRLGRLAKSIVLRRPGSYLRWVRNSLGHGLASLADVALIRWSFILLVASLPWTLLRRHLDTSLSAGEKSARWQALAGLAVLAVGYFAAYLLLVSLVSFPFPRYFISIVLFLPPLMVALVFESCRIILQSFRGSVSPEPAR